MTEQVNGQGNGRSDPIATSEEWGANSVEQFHAEAIRKGLTFDLPLPSGHTVLVTRPPLLEWVMFGVLPETLTKIALESAPLEQRAQALGKTTGNLREMASFIREVVQWAVIRPRIKIGAQGPNEIEPAHVPSGDLFFLLDWVKKGCPGVPVETERGLVSVESLKGFREEHGGETTPGSGDHVS